MYLNQTSKIVYVCGRKGSGKSTLTKTRLIPKFRRVFVCDPNCEYNFDGAYIFEDLNTMLQHYAQIPSGDFIIICRFDDDIDYKYLFKFIYSIGHCTLVMEELNIYVETFLSKEDEDFKKIIRYSRHRQISVIGICQRSADVPRLFTSQCDCFISFHQQEPRDLDYIQKMWGESAAQRVQNLQPHEYAQFGENLLQDTTRIVIATE